MTNEEPKGSGLTKENNSFPEQINPLLTGLFYPGESDEPIEPVTCYLDQAEPLTDSQIKDWLLLPPSVRVEQTPEAEFWELVITEQDWYGDDERTTTVRFCQLRQWLEDRLTGRQVFHVGETEIDLYLLGRQTDGTRAGIRTMTVQT